MRKHAGHARAGDLARRRCGGDRRRDAIEYQQWRRKKAAADTEHAGKNARQRTQPDNKEAIDR